MNLDHKPFPLLGPFLPTLPAMPATPRIESSTVPATSRMGSPAPATTDQNRAQLQQWQNKMHAQFRRAMLGDDAAAAVYVGLPPLPQVNGHQDSSPSKISSQDVSKPHAQLQVETDGLRQWCVLHIGPYCPCGRAAECICWLVTNMDFLP